MVEGERGERGEGEPLGTGGIVMALHGNGDVDEGEVGNGDGAPARVAVNPGIGAYLANGGQAQARLLLELTDSTLLRGLVDVHETAGEGPTALEGFVATLDEQHPRRGLAGDDHAVGRDCRSWVFICV